MLTKLGLVSYFVMCNTFCDRSVSFMTGKEEVLSIMVPLADEEDTDDDDSSRILQPTRV